MQALPTSAKNRYAKYFRLYAAAEAGAVAELALAQLTGIKANGVDPPVIANKTNSTCPIACRREPAGPAWQHSMVVPAYAEDFQQLQRVALQCQSQLDQVVQIWVINCPDNADPLLSEQTQDCLRDVIANSKALARCANVLLRQFVWGQVVLVDRCSEGYRLSRKQGVGGARKIGGDIALKLYALGLLRSAWCAFSDADAILPNDYFARLKDLPESAAAAVFPHRHKPEGDELQRQAVSNYQRKLDLHVAGLKQAGSPYAFHTIGSTIACHLENYLQVRGVPVRAAAEDFYLLNKLVKTGAVVQLTGKPILLSGRRSLRVPFGTGPAIDRALAQGSATVSCYNPVVYELLAVLLLALPEFWKQKKQLATALDKFCSKLNAGLQSRGVAIDTNPAGSWISQVALSASLAEMLAKSSSEEVFCRHFHCWFDGLQTLKFMHWWRDHGLPDMAISR